MRRSEQIEAVMRGLARERRLVAAQEEAIRQLLGRDLDLLERMYGYAEEGRTADLLDLTSMFDED